MTGHGTGASVKSRACLSVFARSAGLSSSQGSFRTHDCILEVKELCPSILEVLKVLERGPARILTSGRSGKLKEQVVIPF